MRISDWSSDVCSSDLAEFADVAGIDAVERAVIAFIKRAAGIGPVDGRWRGRVCGGRKNQRWQQQQAEAKQRFELFHEFVSRYGMGDAQMKGHTGADGPRRSTARKSVESGQSGSDR